MREGLSKVALLGGAGGEIPPDYLAWGVAIGQIGRIPTEQRRYTIYL
ncbi:hypothetical protein REC12_23465 [Desulfosporosinus sp. PR]|nr:hypothetical protein [Desulfosporosinus sp. PR]